MRWADLFTWTVVLHWAVVYRWKCLLVYEGPDWNFLIRHICGLDMTRDCRSKVEYARQEWGWYCSRALKHDCLEQKTCEDFCSLSTVVSAALVHYGARIQWMTRKFCVSFCILDQSVTWRIYLNTLIGWPIRVIRCCSELESTGSSRVMNRYNWCGI